MKSKLYVKENKIGVMKVGNVNYISLTEQTWMRNRDVVAYLGLWERYFKGIEFMTFEMSAGKNSLFNYG